MSLQYQNGNIQALHSESDYLALLMGLLPRGLIWIFDRMLSITVVQDVIISTGDTADWQDSASSATTIQDTSSAEGYSGNLFRRLMSCFAAELARVEQDAVRMLNQTDPGVATDTLSDWENLLALPESCITLQNLTTEERQAQAHTKLFETRTMTKQAYIDYARQLGFAITIDDEPYSAEPRIMGVAIMGVEPMGGYGGYSVMKVTVTSGQTDIDLLKCAFKYKKQAHVTIIYVT